MQIIETNAVLDVPASVATCPYCGQALKVSFDHWVQQEDGSWAIEHAALDCVAEPDLDDEAASDYDNWLAEHTYMPYVYWLPVDVLVTKWVNENYRFNVQT